MEYYISINNEKRGPYSIEELGGRNITAETLVMPENSQQWVAAWTIEELRPLLLKQQTNLTDKRQTAENPKTHIDEPVATGEPVLQGNPLNTTPTQEPSSKKSNKGCIAIFLVALVVLAGLLIVTCPSEQKHKEALTSVITQSVNEAAHEQVNTSEDDMISKALAMIGNALTHKVVDTAVDNLISVDNYMVCSMGTVSYEGRNHIVSIGILGHIFTINKEDIKRAAEKYYQQAETQVQKSIEQQIKESVIDPIGDAFKGAIGDIASSILGGDITKQEPGNEDQQEDSI